MRSSARARQATRALLAWGMNFLVTGGAGFIGSHVCERLLHEGHRVWALDELNDFYDPAIKRRNVAELRALARPFEFFQADITNADAMNGLFSAVRFDQVIHLAARAGVRPSLEQPALWNYLAAWEFAKRKYGGEAKAKEFVAALYKNVPVLDTGARGSSITFAQRNQADVFISWENEAHLLEKEFGNKVDIVYPSLSIVAEPPVTVVDKNVDRKGTRKVAEEYLNYLYSDEGQDIAGKNYYRPISPKAQAKYVKQLPKLPLFTIEQAFGSCAKAVRDHFADGASFDQIYTKK